MSTYAKTRVEGHDYEAAIVGPADRVVIHEDGAEIAHGRWLDEEIQELDAPILPEVKEAIEEALKG